MTRVTVAVGARVAARIAGALVLAVAVVTCRDTPTGPREHVGHVAIGALTLPYTPAQLAQFGLAIDSVRLLAIRPPSDTAARTTVPFAPDADQISINFPIPLQNQQETMQLVVELRGNGQVLFRTQTSITVQVGAPDPTDAINLTSFTYVGPGTTITSLTVTPLDSVIRLGDSLRFKVDAFAGQTPVTLFYVSWSSSNETLAPISANGVLKAPSARGKVTVSATTPNNITGSTPVTFVPLPTSVVAVPPLLPGTPVPPGSPLGTLRARVLALDGLGVKGVPVQFQSTTGGGSVGNAVVISDDSGFVQTTATAGTAAGPGVFSASVAGIATPALFSYTIGTTGGGATQLAFLASPTGGLVGTPIGPVVVGLQDAQGQTVPTASGQVTIALGANPGGATLSGTTTLPAAEGIVVFSDLVINNPGAGYTLVVTSSGLTSATSAPFDVIAGLGGKLWANAAGGNWNNPANWLGGVVPGPTDTVFITLPGDYTVTLDVSPTVAFLFVGSGTGVQTLAVTSQTLTVDSSMAMIGNTQLLLTNGAVSGGSILTTSAGTLVSQLNGAIAMDFVAIGGTYIVDGNGSPHVDGSLTIMPQALLRVTNTGQCCQTTFTVATELDNAGRIELTSAVNMETSLNVTTGTLFNGFGATLAALPGAGGTRRMNAQLANDGDIDVQNQFEVSGASRNHSNSGTIHISGPGGDQMTLSQSGGSFTTGGDILIDAGHAFVVSGGALDYLGGSIAGLGSVSLNNLALDLEVGLTHDTLSLSLGNTQVNGIGTLTVAAGKTMQVFNGAINVPLVINGTLQVDGNSNPAIGGAITLPATGTLRVTNLGFCCQTTLGIANGFTNNGLIELTSQSNNATGLFVTTGGLVNAAGAKIRALPGLGGARTLGAQLENHGVVNIDAPLTINHANSAHTNAAGGEIFVTGGDFTVSQPGSSFTMVDSRLQIAPGRTATFSGGTITYGGTLLGFEGSGTMALNALTLELQRGLAQGTPNLTFSTVTVNGPSTLQVPAGRTLRQLNGAINAPISIDGTLEVDGNASPTIDGSVTVSATGTLRVTNTGQCCQTTLTVANGFTNNGAIELTSAVDMSIALAVTAGTLVNGPSGSITSLVGAGGSRALDAALDNQGVMTVNAPLTMNRLSSVHSNSGTINVTRDLTIGQGGATPSFGSSGTISIAAGQTLRMNGGAFNYTGGTLGGNGSLVLNNGTAAFTPSFTVDTLGLTLSNTTLNGPGTLTIATGRTLTMFNGAINAPLAIAGTFEADGASLPALTGSVFVALTGTLRVTGTQCCQTRLNVSSGFTNLGAIVLTSAIDIPTTLAVNAGALFNQVGATITAAPGAGGNRELAGALTNAGTVQIDAPFLLTGIEADHANNGTIQVTGGNFSIVNSGLTPTFANAGLLNVGPGRTLAITGSGAFTGTAPGTLAGSGTIDLAATVNFTQQLGSVNPGGSPGTLTFTRDLPSVTTSVYNIEIGGTATNQYDRIIVGGTATTSGVLNVTLVNGFTPNIGDAFTILQAGTRTGTFASLNLPTVAGGVWVPTLNGTSVILTLGSASALAPVEWVVGDGVWSQPANWSSGAMPGPGDSVIIGSAAHPGTFTVTLDVTGNVGFLDIGGPIGAGTQTLQVAGPTITLNNGGLVSQQGVVNLAGGLAGGGTIVDSGTINWSSGQLTGAGLLQVAAGGSLNLTTTGLKTLNAKTIQNAGTIVWADGNIISGIGAAVVNQSGGLVNAQGNTNLLYSLGGAQPRITNQAGATFRRSTAAGALGIEVPFDNAGTVDVQTGTLALRAGGTATNDFTLAAGTTLDFVAGSPVFATGSDVTGAGTVRLSGATVAFDAGDTTQIPKLNLQGGSLAGVGTVAINDSLVWTLGTMTGTGVTRIGVGADLLINGAVTFSNRTISNGGTVLWLGGALSSGGNATLRNDAGALIDIQANAAWNYNLGNGVPHIVNLPGGQLTRSVASGTADLRAALDNDGTVTVQSGTLALGGGGTSGGAFTIATPATLAVNGGAPVFGAGSSITGAGAVSFTLGTSAVGGSYDVTGVTSIVGGTANFSGTDTSRMTLSMTSGTLGGTGVALLRTSSSIGGGSLADAGVLRVPAGVTLTINGAVTWAGHTMSNAGQIIWSAGNISSGSGATLNNSGVFDVRGDVSWFYNLGGGLPVVNNAAGATVRRSVGLGTATFAVPIPNAGVLDVQTGTLLLNAGATTSGTQAVAAGATLTYGSGTHSIATNSAFTGAGRVLVDGATFGVDAAAPDTVDARWIELLSGTLNGTGVLRTQDSLVWSGAASINSAVTLRIPATGRMTIRGGVTRNFTNALIANAGVVAWTGATPIASGSNAALRIESGAVFQLESDANWNYNLGGVLPHIDNLAGGLIKRGVATTAVSVGAALNNDGTLDIQTGSVTWTNGGNAKGAATISAGATLGFGGGTHTWSSGSVTGAGTVALSAGVFTIGGVYNVTGTTRLTGGTLNFNTVDTSRVTTLDVSSAGVLSGTSVVLLRGAGSWSGGSMTGSGTLVVPAGVALTVSGTSTKVLADRTIALTGTMSWTQGLMSGTAGIVNVQSGGLLGVEADAQWTTGGTINVQAGGVLKRSVGTGTANLGVTVNNNGTVDATSGTLQLAGGGAGIGTYLASNATSALEFSAGTHAITDGKINGTGLVNFTGATFSIGGSKSSYDVTGTTQVVAGSVSMNTPDTSRFTTWQLRGGQLTGTAHMIVRGSGLWTGGTLGGVGGAAPPVLRVPANVTVNISGTATHTLLVRTFFNQGTVNWLSGNIQSQNAALFDNQSSANLAISAINTWNGIGTASSIINRARGNIFVTTTGTTTIGAGNALTNLGTLDLAAGSTLKLTGPSFANGTGSDLQGVGTLDVANIASASLTNTGTVRPGTSPGILTIVAPATGGGWPQGPGSTLVIEIFGPNPGTGHDQLVINGQVTTGGTLNLVGNGTYQPRTVSLTIMTYGSRVGQTFGTINLLGGLQNLLGLNYSLTDLKAAF